MANVNAPSSHGEDSIQPDPTPRWEPTSPYQKLQPGQIRLLRVERAEKPVESLLRCTLSTHDLSSAPPFTALSYTWGPPLWNINNARLTPRSSTYQIECNDRTAKVGENLYDFLVLCAHDDSHDLQTYLWIDALAINQSDTQERSEQVKRMGDIYQKATRVVIWLGPDDASTTKATKLMNGWLKLDSDERMKLHPAEVAVGHENELLDIDSWQALAQFFLREWFNRAWISLQASGAEPGHNTPARLAAAQRTWQAAHENAFLYALIRARSSKSGNPRDKVYSQLGLGAADIFPDYQASIAEVYITAATYILEHSGSLLLLTCVEGEEFQSLPDLPSWVPDWSVTKATGLRVTGYMDFCAALDRPKRHEISMDARGNRILTIEATKLDTVVETCETKPEMRENLHNEEALWRTLMTNRETMKTTWSPVHREYPALPEPLGSSFRDWVLWRYVVASEPPSTFPPLSSTQSCLLPSKAEIQKAREQSVSDPAHVADIARRASRYDVHYSHAMLVRPFSTQRGYIGLGTQCLRKDDTVWIVPGCRVPLVLRRVAESARHRLVGGAYVHGVMNGEALQRRDLKYEMVSLE
ncbi:heterokaryon incompatibility protein-domain-containing protein, partial [Phaeosphaeria sp. MPI-PUGE-AT-0046c]